MKTILISDPTLRDGNHAVQHSIALDQVKEYAILAEKTGIPIVEVGHGNGIGASSLQVGLAVSNDIDVLATARENLSKSKLAVHCIPGFATIDKDLKLALDIGVDVVRVASHCTEADITERHLNYVRSRGKIAHGALMMTHMASRDVLLEECGKMQSYGAEAVILMDSAGAFFHDNVSDMIGYLSRNLNIDVGFHAHNNLGLAVANSLAAAEAGAKIIDGTCCGFGAGAGNTQLETLVPVLQHFGYDTGINLDELLDLVEKSEDRLISIKPQVRPLSIVSGLNGVFSGFVSHVERISSQFGVDPKLVLAELGKRNAVGGQEDLILDVATNLLKGSR